MWLKIGASVFLVGFQALAHSGGRSLQELAISTVNPDSLALHISVLCSLFIENLCIVLATYEMKVHETAWTPDKAEIHAAPPRQVHP